MIVKNKHTGLEVDLGDAHQTQMGFHTRQGAFYATDVGELAE
jgi:hypothetical protein